mmetsp:Transcript_23685/g.71136  ORF Transcript_23685/g.71136 Transcript_23685/m.71136 type:complete len:205 (+) Transcript_23685:1294-1908(+)
MPSCCAEPVMKVTLGPRRRRKVLVRPSASLPTWSCACKKAFCSVSIRKSVLDSSGKVLRYCAKVSRMVARCSVVSITTTSVSVSVSVSIVVVVAVVGAVVSTAAARGVGGTSSSNCSLGGPMLSFMNCWRCSSTTLHHPTSTWSMPDAQAVQYRLHALCKNRFASSKATSASGKVPPSAKSPHSSNKESHDTLSRQILLPRIKP